MHALLLTTALLALSLSTASAKETLYTLNPAASQVSLTWVFPSSANPEADVRSLSGTLHWDAEHPEQASVRVNIPVNRIHTHLPALSPSVNFADFFHTARYPNITFISSKVVPTAPRHYLVYGQLTVRGITRNTVLNATLVRQTDRHPTAHAPAVNFHATTTLNRTAYDLLPDYPSLPQNITVRMDIEAIETEAYKAMPSTR